MVRRVPQRSKGRRIALTIRLPYDEYREVAVRALQRNWSLSDYVGFCVLRELKGAHKVKEKVGAAKASLARGLDREFEDA